MTNSFHVTINSVNVGASNDLAIGDEMVATGIMKHPSAGAVAVTSDGVAGDFIANSRAHGGPDQAVYLYSVEDLAYWEGELERPMPPGLFGENLTIDRWWPEVRIGDRLTNSRLTLELTFPRVPCATLATRVGDPRFVKRFAQGGRPGVYARVIREGDVEAGDTFSMEPAPADYPLATTLFRAWHDRKHHLEDLRDALRAPLASRWRAAFEYVLAHPDT